MDSSGSVEDLSGILAGIVRTQPGDDRRCFLGAVVGRRVLGGSVGDQQVNLIGLPVLLGPPQAAIPPPEDAGVGIKRRGHFSRGAPEVGLPRAIGMAANDFLDVLPGVEPQFPGRLGIPEAVHREIGPHDVVVIIAEPLVLDPRTGESAPSTPQSHRHSSVVGGWCGHSAGHSGLLRPSRSSGSRPTPFTGITSPNRSRPSTTGTITGAVPLPIRACSTRNPNSLNAGSSRCAMPNPMPPGWQPNITRPTVDHGLCGPGSMLERSGDVLRHHGATARESPARWINGGSDDGSCRYGRFRAWFDRGG